MKKYFSIIIIISIISISNAQEYDNLSYSWYISETDLLIELQNINQNINGHEIEIIRQFNGEKESNLLKKAEAVYPNRNHVLNAAKKAHFKLKSLPSKEEDFWWYSQFDGVRIPYAITASAINYYLELSHAFQKKDFSRSGNIKMTDSKLRYKANIRFQEEFNYNNQKFKNIYVINLRLEWLQYCGKLCAMDFEKDRIIIIEPNGKILGVFLDGEVGVMVS